MKKLYRKGKVHPSTPVISDHLSFLPVTILALTAALSPEDREVLAYLITCSGNNNIFHSNWSNINSRKSSCNQKTTSYTKSSSSSNSHDHPPMFSCDCFRCYMSYWIRWDSSPNRQLIHEIIDAFEDWLLKQGKSSATSGNKNRKDRKRKGNSQGSGELIKRPELRTKDKQLDETDSVDGNSSGSGGGKGVGGGGEEGTEKGSVRRLVSFIGERIWGVLG
ncbi:PREDICTED: uncharacterized protein LOC105141488 [Populus euphratica]|uniref:Uncharacterized protein LOC105141488 n=1 Tax=Populus euphratica TaxID=75702 RepID=A0AAJ6Y947_POPEU|nr:PREDICTED: uncharacterized protein LOC105141488 [Populus euphratica]